jgi:hypothetical protein
MLLGTVSTVTSPLDDDLAEPAAWWQLAAAGAALALVVTGRGDLTILGLALGLAVGRAWQSAAAATAVLALAVRWGTTDLGAVGGAIGALGPSVTVGPPLAAASCWLAAAALALACVGSYRRACVGLAAGIAVALAGPVATTTGTTTAIDLAALVGSVALAIVVAPRLPASRHAGRAAFVLALVALGAAAAW